VRTFQATYPDPEDPQIFQSGNTIVLDLSGNNNPNDILPLQIWIETANDAESLDNYTTAITGMDAGRFLLSRKFRREPTLELTQTVYSRPSDTLNEILTDTPIRVNGLVDDSVYLSNNPRVTGFFGGDKENKVKALQDFFIAYAEATNVYKYRWYIDIGNGLNWFTVQSNRENIVPIYKSSDYVLDIDIDDNGAVSTITNRIEVYGGEKGEIAYTLDNRLSQKQYGVIEGQAVQDTTLRTFADVKARAERELAQKAWPIYSGSVKLVGIHNYDVGEAIMFPEHRKYPEMIFTIVESTINNNYDNDPITTLGFSTDETAIAPANHFEAIAAVIQSLESKTTGSEVVAVDRQSGYSLVKPYNSPVHVVPKNI
jgi:hypothetical protein